VPGKSRVWLTAAEAKGEYPAQMLIAPSLPGVSARWLRRPLRRGSSSVSAIWKAYCHRFSHLLMMCIPPNVHQQRGLAPNSLAIEPPTQAVLSTETQAYWTVHPTLSGCYTMSHNWPASIFMRGISPGTPFSAPSPWRPWFMSRARCAALQVHSARSRTPTVRESREDSLSELPTWSWSPVNSASNANVIQKCGNYTPEFDRLIHV
jgi:hypothetical protein